MHSNDKANEVSNYVRKNILNKKEEYEIGEFLISKTAKKLRNSSKAIFRNYKYVIIKKDDKGLAIVEYNTYIKKTKENIQFTEEDVIYFGYGFIKEHFIYDYAKTCHCYQGSTITEKYTIFEWNRVMISRRWFWTAITRATDFDNVYFYLPKDKDKKVIQQEEKKEEHILNTYFQYKINSYMRQDKEANRPINREKYINVKWLFDNMKKGACVRCGEFFSYDIRNGQIRNCNFTADRPDNSRPHELDNLQPMCIPCNCEKSDK